MFGLGVPNYRYVVQFNNDPESTNWKTIGSYDLNEYEEACNGMFQLWEKYRVRLRVWDNHKGFAVKLIDRNGVYSFDPDTFLLVLEEFDFKDVDWEKEGF